MTSRAISYGCEKFELPLDAPIRLKLAIQVPPENRQATSNPGALTGGTHQPGEQVLKRDAIDLVAAANGALTGIVEHAIFGPEIVDGRAPTLGIVFTRLYSE